MLIKKKLLSRIFNKILEIKSQIKYFIDISILILVYLWFKLKLDVIQWSELNLKLYNNMYKLLIFTKISFL